MKEYWNKHSKDCSIQEMMLDSNAEVISDSELPEILSVLPSYADKDILELGAGIGLIKILSITNLLKNFVV